MAWPPLAEMNLRCRWPSASGKMSVLNMKRPIASYQNCTAGDRGIALAASRCHSRQPRHRMVESEETGAGGRGVYPRHGAGSGRNRQLQTGHHRPDHESGTARSVRPSSRKIYAKRGDVQNGPQCLRKAKEDGYSNLSRVYRDEEFSRMRENPQEVGDSADSVSSAVVRTLTTEGTK